MQAAMKNSPRPVIAAENLSKHYALYARKMDRVVEALFPFAPKRHTPFAALEGVSFSVARGEALGIVGVNGSGKSTLLKILTGVLTPSQGRVTVNGRVSALLELGAGFHPERTGLENVYFQGVISGLEEKEIERYLPDVLAFADIGDYIRQPVKKYSSGMFVRLAFACAIQGDPDILIVDEALAVGDVRFQRKCFQHIETLKAKGVTFIFVSHAAEQIVAHCTRALLLARGRLLLDGEPRLVVNRYLDILFGREGRADRPSGEAGPANAPPAGEDAKQDPQLAAFLKNAESRDRLAESPFYNPYEYRWGNGEAAILDVHVASSGDPRHIRPGDRLALHIKALFYVTVMRPIFGCAVKTREGVTIYGSNSEIGSEDIPYESVEAGEMAHVTYTFRCALAPGEYFVSMGLAHLEGGEVVPLDRRFDSLLLIVHGPANFFGLSDLAMHIGKT